MFLLKPLKELRAKRKGTHSCLCVCVCFQDFFITSKDFRYFSFDVTSNFDSSACVVLPFVQISLVEVFIFLVRSFSASLNGSVGTNA